MNYIIMRGPSLGSEVNGVDYLTLMRTRDFQALVTIVRDKPNKANTVRMAQTISTVEEGRALMSFLESFIKFNGGQSAKAVDDDAIKIALAVQRAASDELSIVGAYGIEIALEVHASTGNKARYVTSTLQNIDLSKAVQTASALELTISKA